MNLIITGATGFTGGEVLRQALVDAAIDQVTVITRRSVQIAHAKLKEIVLNDFLDYAGIPLSGYDACIWCLGISQTQVSEDKYIEITYGYAVAAAQAMFAVNPSLRFCFVSGRSADTREQRPNLFARIKGRTEKKLGELGRNVFVFRPGYIRATARSVPRKDIGRLFAPIASLVSLFTEDFSVDCDRLAEALLDVAKNGSDLKLFKNDDLGRWRLRHSR